MFGGVSFMINNKMVVAARDGGYLLVRADPKRSRELLAITGAALGHPVSNKWCGYWQRRKAA